MPYNDIIMNVLVTGHRGFIGSHIYEDLKSKNYNVYGYDLGDILEDVKYDVIIHMAARGLIRESKKHPYEYFKYDLQLPVKFLELARKNNALFIFPSSGSIEEVTNPYSLSKKNSEEWIELYSKLYGLKYFILKFFNIYGPGSRKGAVYLFTKAAINNETATVYGDGSHIRDYVYIGDVVKLVNDIIENKLNPGKYEVGTGTRTSVNVLISKIEKITGKKINIKNEDYIVQEADSLYAKNGIIKNFIDLDYGIGKVREFINNELNGISTGL
jgi:UDP-glucose 4-epimerase